jgi:hypothetical protein
LQQRQSPVCLLTCPFRWTYSQFGVERKTG